jgi:Na+-transporting NADH:ubiquinone oxidoreductase subunit NqrC
MNFQCRDIFKGGEFASQKRKHISRLLNFKETNVSINIKLAENFILISMRNRYTSISSVKKSSRNR